jgi:hypothetical protein
MMIGRGTEVLGENLPQCSFVHHKPHLLTRTRIRAAAVGSQRLIAWATARPRGGVLLLKSGVTQLLKKFPTCYETRKSITVFTKSLAVTCRPIWYKIFLLWTFETSLNAMNWCLWNVFLFIFILFIWNIALRLILGMQRIIKCNPCSIYIWNHMMGQFLGAWYVQRSHRDDLLKGRSETENSEQHFRPYHKDAYYVKHNVFYSVLLFSVFFPISFISLSNWFYLSGSLFCLFLKKVMYM